MQRPTIFDAIITLFKAKTLELYFFSGEVSHVTCRPVKLEIFHRPQEGAPGRHVSSGTTVENLLSGGHCAIWKFDNLRNGMKCLHAIGPSTDDVT